MDNGQILGQTNGLDKRIVFEAQILFLTCMQSSVEQCLLDRTCTLMVTPRKLATYKTVKNVA